MAQGVLRDQQNPGIKSPTWWAVRVGQLVHCSG
jgi:hypothetical protein